jgi:hypothetical protein
MTLEAVAGKYSTLIMLSLWFLDFFWLGIFAPRFYIAAIGQSAFKVDRQRKLRVFKG